VLVNRTHLPVADGVLTEADQQRLDAIGTEASPLSARVNAALHDARRLAAADAAALTSLGQLDRPRKLVPELNRSPHSMADLLAFSELLSG
jgi:hypothetical protein